MIRSDVVIIGAGVIGLSSAWRIAATGRSVTICDGDPAGGASWAAAGMLAPETEARTTEPHLLELSLASAAMWPRFAADLETDSGTPVGLRTEGTLSVAFGPDDRRALLESMEIRQHLGLKAQWLDSRSCREIEPGLHPRVTGGLLSQDDHQVDNRSLLDALQTAAKRRSVRLEHQNVAEISFKSGEMEVVLDDETLISTEKVILAAGVGTPSIGGLPSDLVLPVRPVKGQILRLRGDSAVPLLFRTVRASVNGWHVYMVPRRSGEIVVGATSEERGWDTQVTAGAVYELLRSAVAVVPEIAEIELCEATARLRPGTPDNSPILGSTSIEGLMIATGHYRNGILLAPITAEVLLAYVEGRDPSTIKGFSPERFSPERFTPSSRETSVACLP